MKLEPIHYTRGSLQIINQLLLPQQTEFVEIKGVQDGYDAIKTMKVRGAPSIAVVGALSLAIELNSANLECKRDVEDFVNKNMKYLIEARPTAVNISVAASDLSDFMDKTSPTIDSADALREHVLSHIEDMMRIDLESNKSIGDYGANHILENAKNEKISILTHCNTGSLATVGYGTALGVVRSLHSMEKLEHVYCTETRAYNQGARLTAFELVHEQISSTLITDSAASIAMQRRRVSAVVVGADRIANNGDTANKIGTYQLAIAAHYHQIPFYIAAPVTTIDVNIQKGEDIPIEERNSQEITHFRGERVAAEGIECWNPAFDVTPAQLITGGIITEHGVWKPCQVATNMSELTEQAKPAKRSRTENSAEE